MHAAVNELVEPVGTHLYGRRMYDVLKAWETMPTGDDQEPVMRDFARHVAGRGQGRLLLDADRGVQRAHPHRAGLRRRDRAPARERFRA